MQARMAERQAAMGQRIEAIKGFYASLTPEQQKVFDSQHMGGMQRTGMKRGHGGHHHQNHQRHHKVDGHPPGGMGTNAPGQPQI
jgi:hypothetical protein